MNYKLTISYKGTNYSGFAKQVGVNTIEQTIIDTINDLFQIKVKLFASGRTDKYVHAYGQVINIKHENLAFEPPIILKALNAKLPSDIRVLECEAVDNKFHARFNAKHKTYQYLINLNSQFNIFEQEIVYQYNKDVDLKKLDLFLNLIKGQHNFLSFSTSELENTTREIFSTNYEIKDEILKITITGNGFLRNMVRMLVGAFLDYNEDKIDLNHLNQMFLEPKKGAAIRKAPGGGLYLMSVTYV